MNPRADRFGALEFESMPKSLGLAGAVLATLVATVPAEAQRYGGGYEGRPRSIERQDGRRRDVSYRCRSNERSGNVLGAIVGGLLGGGGRRGEGALAGRAIDRDDRRRC